ncbi:MAG: hypothetical protein WBN80_10565 [Prochlorococcaceae cyanobacterium]
MTTLKALGLSWFALASLSMAVSAPASAAEWRDSDCRFDRDDGGNAVKVCRDRESIGIFWDDGSYVNGWCDSRVYDIEFEGISRADALTWVKLYCG